jgi:hypothetical protein
MVSSCSRELRFRPFFGAEKEKEIMETMKRGEAIRLRNQGGDPLKAAVLVHDLRSCTGSSAYVAEVDGGRGESVLLLLRRKEGEEEYWTLLQVAGIGRLGGLLGGY